MVAANLKTRHQFICITDSPVGLDCDTFPLWKDPVVPLKPGHHDSYRRLKMFSPWAREMFGPRQVLSLDLDTLVAGPLDPLITRHDVRLLKGAVSTYNGSMWLHSLGTRTHVWDEFHPEQSIEKTRGIIDQRTGKPWQGSDQVWLSYSLPDEATYTKDDGCWLWDSKCRRMPAMPEGARLLFFYGEREAKPWSDQTAGRQPFIHELYMSYLGKYL